MKPYPLIDFFRRRRADAPAGSRTIRIGATRIGKLTNAIIRVAARHGDPFFQAGALLTGTLAFVPFLVAYFFLCANH